MLRLLRISCNYLFLIACNKTDASFTPLGAFLIVKHYITFKAIDTSRKSDNGLCDVAIINCYIIISICLDELI